VGRGGEYYRRRWDAAVQFEPFDDILLDIVYGEGGDDIAIYAFKFGTLIA